LDQRRQRIAVPDKLKPASRPNRAQKEEGDLRCSGCALAKPTPFRSQWFDMRDLAQVAEQSTMAAGLKFWKGRAAAA